MSKQNIVKSGTLCFKVQDEFINNHARQLLIEGEIEKAISFLKTLTTDEDIIADVLFGKKKFVEIDDTQEFRLASDSAIEMLGLELCSSKVSKRLWEKRRKNEELAKHYGIEIPKIVGNFSNNDELNIVLQAKKNYNISDRCKDEIMHPEIFINYDVGNPMNCLYFMSFKWKREMIYSRKYKKNYCLVTKTISSKEDLVDFFQVLTQNFELNTRFEFQTYDPKTFVEESEMLPQKHIIDTVIEKRKNKLENKDKKDMMRAGRNVKQYMKFDELKAINPRMGKIAENTFDRMFTGKTYDINNPDDVERDSGFIDKEGNWYSAEPMEHEPFAHDYLVKNKLVRKKDTGVLSCKDELIKDYGWIAVTVGGLGIYVIGGKFSREQRQTLKKWFKKYGHVFHPIGDIDSYDDITDEKDFWFEGARC